jgi:hypothetical protein
MQLGSSAKLPEKPLIVEAVRLRWTDRKMTRKVKTETFWDLDEDFGPWLALVRDWLNAWMGGVRGPVAVEATPRVRIASSGYGGPVGGGGFAQGGVYLGSRRVARPIELRGARRFSHTFCSSGSSSSAVASRIAVRSGSLSAL